MGSFDEAVATMRVREAAPELLEVLKTMDARYRWLLSKQEFFPDAVDESILDRAQALMAKIREGM